MCLNQGDDGNNCFMLNANADCAQVSLSPPRLRKRQVGIKMMTMM